MTTNSKQSNHPDQTHNQEGTAVRPPAPGALTYNGYLKVHELKQLQVCESNPPHHDETLFIIIHQSYELWFKLILHEIDEVFSQLSNEKIRRAIFYMRRVNSVMKLLVQQIHILETMTPTDFLAFRGSLSPASGFGSTQFREIEFATGAKYPELMDHFVNDPTYAELKRRFESPSLRDTFYSMLRKRGFNLPEDKPGMPAEEAEKLEAQRLKELLKLYLQEDEYSDLHDLAECFIELDELILLWRAHHMTVVERIIGFRRGTGGSEGVGYLQTTLAKRCFPDLWKLRTCFESPAASGLGDMKAPAGETPPPGCPFHSH